MSKEDTRSQSRAGGSPLQARVKLSSERLLGSCHMRARLTSLKLFRLVASSTQTGIR